jgi:glycosyltransferase involved in cell wall biosynthesis
MFLTVNLVLKNSGIDAYKQIRLLYDACLLTEDVNEINIFAPIESPDISRIVKSFKDNQFAKINYLFGPNAINNYLQYTLDHKGGDLILNLGEGMYFSKEYLKRVHTEYKNNKSRECIFMPSHTLFYKDNILIDNRPIEHANIQLLYAFDDELSSLPVIYSKKALSNSRDIVRSHDSHDTSAAVLLNIISEFKLVSVPALSFASCNNEDCVGVVGIDNSDWMSLAKNSHTSDDLSSNQHDMSHASKFIRRDSATKKYLKVQHEVNREYAKAVKTVILKRFRRKTTVTEPKTVNYLGLDDQLFQDWSVVNGYEPMIRPSLDILKKISYRPARISPNAQLYFELLSNIKDGNYEHCVLVPHIIRGGADLAIIKIVSCLAKTKKVLVVTTLPVESPWIAKVESLKNVQVLQINQQIFYNDSVDIPKILYVIANNNCVSAITVINSSAAYEMIKRFGVYIIDTRKVYLHAYAFDMTEDGYIFNVIQNGLVDTYKRVDTYVTDSNGFKKQIIEIYGFNEDKITTLYLPTEIEPVKRTEEHKNTRKVLWASRVSSAKLVHVAVEIGAQLRDIDVELHVYGALDHEYDNGIFEKMITPYQNIFYHGKYDGFRSIDVKEYDLYLLTSKNEGMPNVILEALAKNMFVVAPSVGGIPEVISDGINGYLVRDKFNPSAYVEKIIKYYSNRPELDKQAITNRSVLKRHSQKSYEECVKNIYNLEDF